MSKTATAKSKSLTAAASRVGIHFAKFDSQRTNSDIERAFYQAVEETEETCRELGDLRAEFDIEDGPTTEQSDMESRLEKIILAAWAENYIGKDEFRAYSFPSQVLGEVALVF